MSKNIYGIHDFSGEWADLVAAHNRGAWCVYTHALGCNPNDHSGFDYREATQRGVTPIARLNCGYGTEGTIPPPDKFDDFVDRIGNWVESSIDCTHWIIGNEIAMSWDWPNGVPIDFNQYLYLYKIAQQRIRAIQPGAVIMPQAPAPWNVELHYGGNPTGDWVKQLSDMLECLADSEVGGIAIHTYSRGYDPSDITRDFRMGEPWGQYHSGFLTYQDYMLAIPISHRQKPVFITETNGNSQWSNYKAGWVQAAYREIERWNADARNQQIHALCLFRWAEHDWQWHLGNNEQVLADFTDALEDDYRWREMPVAQIVTEFVPGDQVISTVYLNLRKAPGKVSEVQRAIDPGTVIRLLSGPLRRDGINWWEVDGGWVAEESNGDHYLMAYADNPFDRAFRFILKWEGGLSWDKNDPGNWTGCQIGVGRFGGTRYGISACSYPDLDIPNLSLRKAYEIYYNDYWMRTDCGELPWPLSLYVMDCAVNCGVGVALELLHVTKGNLDGYVQLREQYYRNLAGRYPAMGRYLSIWLDRTKDIVAYGMGNTRSRSGQTEIRRRRRRRDGVCG